MRSRFSGIMIHSKTLISQVILLLALLGVTYSSYLDYGHHGYFPHPRPYHFGYGVKDYFGGGHYRKEHADGHGSVRGSYGYSDPHGIHREVHYVADHRGFRAKIKTNEPGTAPQHPAHVNLHSQPIHLSYGYST